MMLEAQHKFAGKIYF